MGRTRRFGALVAAGALIATISIVVGQGAIAAAAPASAVDHRPECQANILAANDDGSTGVVPLPFPINFFGNVENSLYVNNNGNVTFDSPMSTFTPFGLTTNIGRPVIAPFFADVDTQGAGSLQVSYGASADGKDFCVNWVQVGYFSAHADKLNSFQMILEDQSGAPGGHAGDFDIVFNYDQVQWETGDASGGSGGLGGAPARVGFSAGTGVDGTYFEFDGSGQSGAFLDGGPEALNAHNRNSTTLGRYRFPVRSGDVPIGATVHGTAYANSVAPENAIPGTFVQLCPTTGGRGCGTSTTDATGGYTIAGLPIGTYTLSAYPGGSIGATPTSRQVQIDDFSDQTQDIVFETPKPLPAGSTITNRGVNGGIPTLYWTDPLTLTSQGCPGALVTYTISSDGTTYSTGGMTETATPGDYTASIPPLYPNHGYARVTIHFDCPGTTADQDVAFDVYIDPSGTVQDTFHQPIADASVTLLRSDAATGPFAPVPDGSSLMSVANRVNPDSTDSDGHFGWDVVAGYYEVQASAPNCHAPGDAAIPTVTSDILTIPPAVTDLVLTLECNSSPVTSPQTLSWTTAPPATSTYGASFTAAASSTSGLPVTISTAGACTGSGVSPVQVTASAAGTCQVSAGQAGNGAFDPATPLTSTVAVGPATLIAQPHAATVQYSDVLGNVSAVNVSGFQLDDGPGVVTGVPSCTTTATTDASGAVTAAPGTYPITCSGGLDAGPNYSMTYGTANVVVTAEDATTAYTGATLVNTAAASATVPLSATVSQSADGHAGDLTRAGVEFDVFSASNVTTTPDYVVTTGANAAGSATGSVNLPVGAYLITTKLVGGSFTGPAADPATVTVQSTVPATGRASGVGFVTDPSGTSALARRSVGAFAFAVGRKSSGQIQGSFVYSYKGPDGLAHVVQATNWSSFTVSGNHATFVGKATVRSFRPRDCRFLAGVGGSNYSIRVNVTDVSGGIDRYALTVTAPDGSVFHTVGTPSAGVPVVGGITVRS